ncbi:unnamed protein product [Adineta steineri]|uniref:SUEL-type lectin domain-containing protein n=1 Tax=Adineta steineri TaxID=433720 RepID=A0A815GVH5_9BILA|nr:unnamed protein product [Adineta steineri]CAF1343482.1 unnamed protein product [Adineta steineri]CAF1593894.1 unnamed protein product [Adineta steineri]CAF1593983.1 unnamed protein product [Adineta steineri]
MYINKCLLILLLCCSTLKFVNLLSVRETDNRQHNQTKADPIVIEVSWTAHDYDLHTIPSLQLVTNPLVSRQFSPVSKEIFANLKQLNAEYARYAVWFPYPKLAVAELDPPSGLLQCGNVGEDYPLHLSCEQNGGVISQIDFASYGTAMGACGQMKQGSCHAENSSSIVQRICIGQKSCTIIATNDIFGDPCYGTLKRLLVQMECNPPQNNTYWNFTYMDPMLEDFLDATDGHSRIISFSTQPTWLFQQDTPHIYPDNATYIDWGYPVGTKFVDESMQALGDYYGRVVAWYTRAGFIDEYGLKHNSGYEYNWDYTEIFNEIEGEHQMSIEYYTRAYDAVIQGIRRHTNNYDMKYVGMALENHNEFNFYKYFLNHSNHAPDIPLDMISYHFYAIGTSRTDPQSWENFFPQLDKFTIEVEQIEQIRKNLSPQTRTTIDELGVILPNDNDPNAPLFPLIYWNAAAALYAYSWGKLSRQNIDVVGHSQLVGYPQLPNLQLEPQYPSVALLNWTTGEGTAKYWISKLLIDTADIDNDQAVITRTTDVGDQNIFSQAFTGKNNRRWVLIINKRYASMNVSLSGCTGGKMQIINEASGFGPPTEITLTSNQITLTPFAIAIVHMPTAKK